MIPPRFPQAGPFAPDNFLTTPPSGGMPGLSPDAPPSFSAPIEPPEPLPLPESPSPEFQKEAFEYIGQWSKGSRDWVKAKERQIKLGLADLHGKLNLKSYELKIVPPQSDDADIVIPEKDKIGDEHLTQFLWPSAPNAVTIATNSHNAIFGGPEWCTVVAETGPGPTQPPQDMPAAYKAQRLLIQKCEESRFHDTIFQAILRCWFLPAVPAKAFWFWRPGRKRVVNPATFEITYDETPIQEYPAFQLIEPDRWLPDPDATCTDVQRWTGVGHIATMTYNECLAWYTAGIFTLNEADFKDRFKDVTHTEDENRVDRDPDLSNIITDPDGKVWIWEWHGKLFDSALQEFRECYLFVATEPDAESTAEGILMHLSMEPMLDCGLRPFDVLHWMPEPAGAFCVPPFQYERHVRVLLSKFFSQLQDIARRASGGGMIVAPGTQLDKDLSEDATISPFRIYRSDRPREDVAAMPVAQIDLAALQQAMGTLQQVQERISMVANIFQGLHSADSATEASIMDKRSLGPFQAILDRACRSFIEPALNKLLSLLQQHTFQTQSITDDTGKPIPLGISAEELRSGKFRVKTTLTAQDTATAAKGQQLIELLRETANFQPMLQTTGWLFDIGGLIKLILNQFPQSGVERLLTRTNTFEQQLMQQNSELQQQLQQLQELLNSGPQPGPQDDGTNGGSPPQKPWRGGPLGEEQTDMNVAAQQAQFGMAGGPL